MPNGTEAERPMMVVAVVWNDYKSWARTARSTKAAQEKARNWALSLGVLGAATATLSSQIGPATLAQEITLGSAVLIGLAAFIGRELLTPDRETAWARSRILAEALQRQVWLALMRVPPYQGADAADKLKDKAEKIVLGVGLAQATEVGASEKLKPPEVHTVDDYIRLRVMAQIDWYQTTAATRQKSLLFWKKLSVGLGALAMVLGIIGAQFSQLSAWVPVITSISAAVLTLVQAGRFQSMIPLYQQTARQLSLELAAWQDSERKDPPALAQACEDIMSKENESWRTDWLAKTASAELRLKRPPQGAS